MPKFSYISRDRTGRKITGYEEAVSQDELAGRLQAKGLIVINILAEPERRPDVGVPMKSPDLQKGRFKALRNRITSSDLVIFSRQLSTLLESGVTILKSLDIISQQVPSHKFYIVLRNVQRQMEKGLSLHEAMAKHPKVFSELWVNLVESGEASGNLAIVLDRLAMYLERNAEFRRKVISALIYPSILMIAGIGALLFLTIKIIPTFGQIFSEFNMQLPFITRLLIATSNFIRRFIIVMIGAGIAGFFIFRNYIKTAVGRRAYEKFKFRLILFGEFFRAIVVERFASEMATLTESGVPILYSLEITEHSVDNLIMSDTIRQIKEDVRQGKSLSVPLEKSGYFEPMVVQMISIGEEIGELSPMFKKISVFYQGYVETFLARFISLFEPLMLVFMGIIIGIMVIGMFLPVFQISSIGGGAG